MVKFRLDTYENAKFYKKRRQKLDKIDKFYPNRLLFNTIEIISKEAEVEMTRALYSQSSIYTRCCENF